MRYDRCTVRLALLALLALAGALGLASAQTAPGAALPDMTSAEYQRSRADADLHKVIKSGRGLMPPFGDQLSDLGITELVKHVRTLSRAP